MNLKEKIDSRTAEIAVIGLGYVGLPLALEFARAGFPVTGLDVDARKVESLRQGRSYIADINGQDVAVQVNAGRLRATTDYEALRAADVIFICVPTPFDAMKAPDLSFIRAAAEGIAQRLRREQIVILQSTTYPGTTEEVVLPILEKSGLKAGVDFCLGFSPERIDPGNRTWTFRNTPKVVGGLTPQCAELSRALLACITPNVHVVSSPRAAEMTKLLENIFRSVNIALVNELALLTERMGIDFWEVVEAAATKPFGFMPFRPGPGVGGHCIPVDPYYLSWKAREFDFYTKFIELAAEVNGDMPYHVADLVRQALTRCGKTVRGARILVLGVAFKSDVDDARNSPAERLMELLWADGAEVRYHDPHVPHFHLGPDVFLKKQVVLDSVPLTEEEVQASDCVVIVSGHRVLDYAWVVRHAPLVVDTPNAAKAVREGREKIWRVGAPPGT
ncbi:MAG: nucleotide sugar dehydrogenase [Anaerolineae bacterium]|nr:nucleotide sugar dehydrogenase [Anaerolineae bacterium]